MLKNLALYDLTVFIGLGKANHKNESNRMILSSILYI